MIVETLWLHLLRPRTRFLRCRQEAMLVAASRAVRRSVSSEAL